MAIFIPRWQRWGNRRPSGPQQINWNSDLSRGLTFLAGFGPNDLVNNLPETLSADVTKLEAGGGYNFITRTNTNNPGVTFGDSCGYPATGMTATVIAKASNWTQSDSTAISGLIGKAEASGNQGRWALSTTNTTLSSFVATTGGNRSISAASVLVNGTPHIITWASFASSGTDYLYLDGKVVGSTSTQNGTVPATALSLRLGAYCGSPNSSLYYGRFIGEIPLSFLHNRKIIADEAKEIGIYPYQILKPRNQFFILGPTNETANVALTTVNPAIAIGASQLQHADAAITTTNPTIAAELSQTLHADAAITTVNPAIAASIQETVALASVALTTQNPIIAARITGGEPDYIQGGVPYEARKRSKVTEDEQEELQSEGIVPAHVTLKKSLTEVSESRINKINNTVNAINDHKDVDDVKAIVQFVKEYRSNIIRTWLN